MNPAQTAVPPENKTPITPRGIIIVCVAVFVLVLVCIFLSLGSPKDSPEYALEQVRNIRSDSDIQLHQDYITGQGQKVLKALTMDTDKLNFQPSFGDPHVTGQTCSVAFHDSKTEGELQFRKSNIWQLNDVVFSRINGHPFHTVVSNVVDPLLAFEEAMKVKTPGEVAADDRYFSDKGKRVWKYAIESKRDHSESNHDKMLYGDPIVGPTLVQFPAVSEDGKIEMRFMVILDQGLWKFNDIYVVRADGNEVGLYFSDRIDHPILSSLKLLFQ